MNKLTLEGIPAPGAVIYSAIVAKSRIMQDFYHLVADEVLAKMASGKLLDIGTGPGFLPLEITQRGSGIEARAIDISPKMVEIARKNAEQMGLQGRVEFVYGSAGKIPYSDGYFDLVVSTGSFHHWAQPVEYFKEIYRVLKSGGEAWIYDLRQDISPEARLETRKKYGWLLSAIFMNVVRLHSSVSRQELEKLGASPGLNYSSTGVVDKGLILKQELKK